MNSRERRVVDVGVGWDHAQTREDDRRVERRSSHSSASSPRVSSHPILLIPTLGTLRTATIFILHSLRLRRLCTLWRATLG